MNAETYLGRHWGPHAVWTHLKNRKHRTRLSACAGLVRGESFCDVGCAFGHSTEIMNRLRPGNWTGVEFSREAVTKAYGYFPNSDWLYMIDVEGLCLLEQRYDSVVCSEVMEHVEDDSLLVKRVIEMARLRAVFTTPTDRVKDPGHLRLYTAPALEELFKPWPHKIIFDPPFFFIIVDREGNFE